MSEVNNKTEQSIIDSIGDYDDTHAEESYEDIAASEEQADEPDSQAFSEDTSVESASADEPQASVGNPQAQEQRPSTPIPKYKEQAIVVGPRRTELKFDQYHNVVDEQGRVLAHAGTERTLYENFIRQRDTAQTLLEEINKRDAQLQQISYLNNLPKQYDLQPNEVDAAFKLVQAWKNDPAGTLRSMLVEAKARGIDVLQDDEGKLQLDSLRGMIQQELSPITRQSQERIAQQRAMEEGARQAALFFAKYPDASTHESEIATLVSNNGLDAEAAYWQLQTYALRNGYDWNQPLAPQIQARQQGVAIQPTAKQAPPRVHSGTREVSTTPATQDFTASSSFKDIIQAAMRQNGFHV